MMYVNKAILFHHLSISPVILIPTLIEPSLKLQEDFTEPNVAEAHEGFQEIVVQRQEVGRLLGSLDIMKTMGQDGLSGWALRESKDHLIRPICEVITSSIKEGTMPQDWKRATIVLIYKEGRKTGSLIIDLSY